MTLVFTSTATVAALDPLLVANALVLFAFLIGMFVVAGLIVFLGQRRQVRDTAKTFGIENAVDHGVDSEWWGTAAKSAPTATETPPWMEQQDGFFDERQLNTRTMTGTPQVIPPPPAKPHSPGSRSSFSPAPASSPAPAAPPVPAPQLFVPPAAPVMPPPVNPPASTTAGQNLPLTPPPSIPLTPPSNNG